MGQIKVVTDTAASVPPELVAKYGLGIARYAVNFGTESFVDDGIELSVDGFEAKRTETGQVPKTGIPSAGQFVQLFRSIAQPGDTIFSVHIGSKISGIVGSAQMAAAEVPELNVVVYDTHTVSMATGFLAIAAAEAAQAGATKDEITKVINDTRPRIDFLSTSVELEYIKESGRIIGGDKAADAAVKNVPILRFQDGKPGVVELTRTHNTAMKRSIELFRETAAGRRIKKLAISHANREEVAMKYREMVERELAPQEIVFGQLGITLMAHLGPGALLTSVLYA